MCFHPVSGISIFSLNGNYYSYKKNNIITPVIPTRGTKFRESNNHASPPVVGASLFLLMLLPMIEDKGSAREHQESLS